MIKPRYIIKSDRFLKRRKVTSVLVVREGLGKQVTSEKMAVSRVRQI